jgi:single-stranded-DNA-specific exonuclease
MAILAETDGPVLGVANSVMGRVWLPRCRDDRLALALAQRLAIPEIIARILIGRGIGLEDAEAYLAPSLRTWLPDPAKFADMDMAAERLARAIRAGEGIALFGDYDVDGATSVALMSRFLRALGANPQIYIPDRLREGYGPTAPAMRRLGEEGAKVVLTLDCGTGQHTALASARAFGLDVIVVDHHLAEPALPPAAAIVNPHRLDRAGPAPELAAVGLAFLLSVAVNRRLRQEGWFADRPEPDLMRWLDLVALGTVCDLAPLRGVNRALVAQGLKILAMRRAPGLAALSDIAGLEEPPGVYHLAYLLGPRINAGGRIGQADLGVRLLLSDEPAEASRLAGMLDRLNRERQAIEAEVLAAALGQIGRQKLGAVAVAMGDWHPGVIGIVAAKLKEATDRPSIVIALANGVGKGSGRSVAGVDLGAAVTAARQAGHLENGGGHPMAAGFTVTADKIEAFKDFLERRIAAMRPVPVRPSLGLDGTLGLGAATEDFLDLMSRAGPYGAGNPEPRFALVHARLTWAEAVGEKHVRCMLADGAGNRLKGIAFASLGVPLGPALLKAYAQAKPWHVAGHLRADYFRGDKRLQFVIEDAAETGK